MKRHFERHRYLFGVDGHPVLEALVSQKELATVFNVIQARYYPGRGHTFSYFLVDENRSDDPWKRYAFFERVSD